MEQYAYKDATLRIFRDVLEEPDFRDWPDVGIAVQAYLKDSCDDLVSLARWAQQRHLSFTDAANTLHPVQQAWINEQVPMCGFCQNGMMIKAVELLEHTPAPTSAQIKTAFTTDGPSPHLCRCGTYVAIIEAVQKASAAMACVALFDPKSVNYLPLMPAQPMPQLDAIDDAAFAGRLVQCLAQLGIP